MLGYELLNGYFTSVRVVHGRPYVGRYLPQHQPRLPSAHRMQTVIFALAARPVMSRLPREFAAETDPTPRARVAQFLPRPPFVLERNKLHPNVQMAGKLCPRHLLESPLMNCRKTSGLLKFNCKAIVIKSNSTPQKYAYEVTGISISESIISVKKNGDRKTVLERL